MKDVELKIDGETYQVPVAESILDKSLGLRFRSSGKMLFPLNRKSVIDGFFVFGKLYLYFIKEGKVVEKAILKPWRLYRPSERPEFLLESSEQLDLRKGDEVEVNPSSGN